jgi:hypothetical protein
MPDVVVDLLVMYFARPALLLWYIVTSAKKIYYRISRLAS